MLTSKPEISIFDLLYVIHNLRVTTEALGYLSQNNGLTHSQRNGVDMFALREVQRALDTMLMVEAAHEQKYPAQKPAIEEELPF